MQMKDEREKLIEELEKLADKDTPVYVHVIDIADFILADRKRIVEPLLKSEPQMAHSRTIEAIRETLKRAGL